MGLVLASHCFLSILFEILIDWANKQLGQERLQWHNHQIADGIKSLLLMSMVRVTCHSVIRVKVKQGALAAALYLSVTSVVG
jgi:hypothetical protein